MTTSPNGTTAQRKKLRIAVVQPHLAVGAVEMNLRLCASLVREASVMHSPDVILLPEAMTSPNVFHRSLRRVPQPVDGAPYQMIVRLAKELHCTVGGGFLSVRGQHARHTYVLAEPDGTTHLHDKDEPSMWETNFYSAGKDQGLTSTSFGNVGLAMGFEWGRSRTARRLRNKADVVLGGSCWWGGPTWPVMREWMARDHQYNALACGEAPTIMARMVGAPVAVAQHVGRVESDTPMLPGVGWSTMFSGDSQIVDASGTILARLGPEDYNAIACAEVEIGPQEPIHPIPVGFWTQPAAGIVQALWHYQKLHGRISYKVRHALGGFPWQHNPPTDLPNYNPAGAPSQLALDDLPAESIEEAITANADDTEAQLT
jgi:predicted amidohydrolase